MATLLLDGGANVNAGDREGTTSLVIASEGGHAALASLLLNGGSVVDAANSHGVTSLMCASGNGQETVIELLLQRGADASARVGMIGVDSGEQPGGLSSLKEPFNVPDGVCARNHSPRTKQCLPN